MNIHPDLITSMANAHLADLHAEAARSRIARRMRPRGDGSSWWRRRRVRPAPELRLVTGTRDVTAGDVSDRVA